MFGYRLRSNVADPEEVDIMLKKVYRLLNVSCGELRIGMFLKAMSLPKFFSIS
jgi:hypothetical protein